MNSEQADQNYKTLAAIEDLERSAAFTGYFLRRVGERKAALEKKILEDDTLTKDQREEARQTWKEVVGIMVLHQRDKAAVRSMAKMG